MCALSKTGWRKHCSVAVPSLVCFFAFLFSTFVRGYVVYSLCISSVQFSCSVVCDPLWPHGLQHPRLPCPSPSPRACSNSCPSSWWCHPTISSCHPLILLPSIFPRIRVFSKESVLCIRWPKCWSFNFSISPSNVYSRLISFRTVWFQEIPKGLSSSPRDSQEFSPTPQFKSINSLALSCRGPAPVDPGWFEGGDGVGVFGKIHI